jgi:hypothetical protein
MWGKSRCFVFIFVEKVFNIIHRRYAGTVYRSLPVCVAALLAHAVWPRKGLDPGALKINTRQSQALHIV